MKKHAKKLQIKRATIRLLRGGLDVAAGGTMQYSEQHWCTQVCTFHDTFAPACRA